MIGNLPDKLREVTGLTTFAELFGFNWDDDSDWCWSDVAEKIALEVEEYYRCGYEDGLRANTKAAFEAAKQAFGRICYNKNAGGTWFQCSNCGTNDAVAIVNYCPHCGAKVLRNVTVSKTEESASFETDWKVGKDG